jgi:hypothetical protein
MGPLLMTVDPQVLENPTGEQRGRSAVGGAPAIAPGLVIADRYRVEALLTSRNPGQRVGQLCRGYDEVLARPVALLLVPEDDPGVPDVLAGARAAARLTHAALVRVYDAGEVPGLAFVVTEFLSGGSLEEQLLVGPLDPDAAVDLVTDLSTAVAAAHAVGLHGLSLTPRNVLFTATGVPRLAGIALAGHTARDAGTVGYPDHLGSETATQMREPDADQLSRARFDAVGLARLLYAALTGRWPGPASESSLPPAPYAEGHLCTPRQVRGGVPREVDAVVAQALGDDLLRRGLPAIASPAEFAAALTPLRTPLEGSHPFHDDTAPIEGLELRRRATTALPGRQRWRVWAVLVGVVLIGVAIGALLYSGPHSYLRFVTGAPAPTPNHSVSATQSATPNAPGRLTPRAVSEFDPYGDHTDPHTSEAPRAVDGNPATAWRTQIYRTADLGKLKPGVGLLVDFGSSQSVSAVGLQLVGTGTSVQLFESSGSTPPVNEKAMTAAAALDNAPSAVTLHPPPGTSARYWVVWLTRLPPGPGGFQGGVSEMTFLP